MLQSAVSLWSGLTASRDLLGVESVRIVGSDVGSALDIWNLGLGLGLMVLVIAEPFRVGAAMRSELKYIV
ncbi:MAG: hypothetical protein R6U70_05050 [Bacillota bacterium]